MQESEIACATAAREGGETEARTSCSRHAAQHSPQIWCFFEPPQTECASYFLGFLILIQLCSFTCRFHEHPQNLHIYYQYQLSLLLLWIWKVLKSCTEKLFALTTFTIPPIRSSKNARLGSLVLRRASFPIRRYHKAATSGILYPRRGFSNCQVVWMRFAKFCSTSLVYSVRVTRHT